MKVLVIIPAYNEEKSIENVVREVKMQNVDYLVINDCSKDKTLSILKEKELNHLDLRINLGIGGGVQAGYKYAYENNYDVAIQLDGDGQHDPIYIKNMVEPIANGRANMVIGSRFIKKEGFQSSFFRRLGINWLSGLIKLLTGKKIYDVTSGYRAVDRKLIEVFKNDYAQDYPEPEAIIKALKVGGVIEEMPMEMKERQGGESSIRAFKSVYYMLKVTIALIICRIKEV